MMEEDASDLAIDNAIAQAEARWDRWDTDGCALLDRILDGHAATCAPEGPSAEIVSARDGAMDSQDGVRCVNRAARRRAMKVQMKAERKAARTHAGVRPASSNQR
ncbi:MAG: hypothetical protein WA948_00165 [Pontixanthobacter sp.]